MESAPEICLRRGKLSDLPFIQKKAKEWRLDDERLAAKDFVVAENLRGELVGFGRIKKYRSCYELGTVGVLPEHRKLGIGGKIVKALIAKFPSREVWITTDLAGYFERFGFRIVDSGPRELVEKISDTCRIKGRKGVKIMLAQK